MEQDKAIALRDLINDAYITYNSLSNIKSRDTVNIDEAKARFTSEQFAAHYDAFIKELDSNILKYKNYQIIKEYIDNNFMVVFNNDYEQTENYKKLFQNSRDITFNAEIFLNVVKYSKMIIEFQDKYTKHKPVGNLYPYFRKIANVETDYSFKPDFDRNYDVKDYRGWVYRYEISEKIKRFTDFLYDFKQWQVEYDEKIETENGIRYKYTDKYCPDFEVLCNLELEKLYKMLEIERMESEIYQPPVQNSSEDQKPPYRWNSSDTDLIELITALFHSNAIKRRDNKNITRKELMNYFQQIFDIQLKDPEGMLSRATNRKKNMTPYIDKLKQAFETYADDKLKNN